MTLFCLTLVAYWRYLVLRWRLRRQYPGTRWLPAWRSARRTAYKTLQFRQAIRYYGASMRNGVVGRIQREQTIRALERGGEW